MANLQNQNQNHLLAALPTDEFMRLSPYLEVVPMPLDKIYYEPGLKLQHVYFPATSIVSLHYIMENGTSTEIAGVGNEGMLGIPLLMGCDTTPSRAFVRTAGYGYKLKARLLMEEFNRAGSMRRLLLRYTHALITQISQTAVCRRNHSVDQQLCRWLLLTLDRMQSNELVLTQELVATMIGVHREGLAESLGKLQQAGFICNHRGRITVLDRSGLENQACECHEVVKREFDRLRGLDWDWRPMPESVETWSRADMNVWAPT